LIKGGEGAVPQDAGKLSFAALRHPDENQDPGLLADRRQRLRRLVIEIEIGIVRAQGVRQTLLGCWDA